MFHKPLERQRAELHSYRTLLVLRNDPGLGAPWEQVSEAMVANFG